MPLILVSTRLSDRISVTPEGYLLAEGVALARTGALEYLAEEVPITPPEGGGMVQVYRLAEDLFDPLAMASFEGRPFTLGHPDDDVGPDNWPALAKGVVQNVRRGEGAEADLLLGDILITAADAIKAVDGGQRELSCGYDAAYTEIAPGVGRQARLRGNHVALVNEGRCGPRCAIRDRRTKTRDSAMKKPRKGLMAAIFGSATIRKAIDADPKARKALDEAIAEEVKDEDPDPEAKPEQQPATDEEAERTADDMGEIKLLLRSILEKLDGGAAPAKEPEAGSVTDEEADPDGAEEGVQDEDIEEMREGAPTADRRPGKPSHRTADAALVRDVAILAPSLAVGRGDPAPVVKRMALRTAVRDASVRRVVDAALGKATLDSATRAQIDTAFASAVEVARVRANTRTADAFAGAGKARDAAPGRAGQVHDTPASLNKMFAEHRRQQKG